MKTSHRRRIWLAPGVFLTAAILAALAPLRHRPNAAGAATSVAFPGWPTHYEGRRLVALAMSEREAVFASDFPGHIGRFTDGEHEIIVRYIVEPTRRLHPAADCLKAVGFSITPAPVRREKSGSLMSCNKAERRGQTLRVCEVIRNDQDEHWPDVSAWYWSAMIGGARGPWWSFVVAEPG
jgi:hypothetical protein